jgi:hypothetical protein
MKIRITARELRDLVLRVCLIAAGVIVLAAIGGCTTTADGQKHLDMALVCPIANGAGQFGTAAALQAYPQYRPAFVAARDGLRLISITNGISADDLASVLKLIPVKQLQGTNGSLLMSGGGVMVFGLLQGEIGKVDKKQLMARDVAPLAGCIAAGMTAGLGE